MAITEIVIPMLKQTEETRQFFQYELDPLLVSTMGSAPGLKRQILRRILQENNKNVQQSVSYVLGIEWEEERNFREFFGSEEFKGFVANVVPHVTGPPKPEVYNTNVSPSAIFSSGNIEIIRVGFENELELAEIKTAWKGLVGSIGSVSSGVSFLDGRSVNLDEDMFLGMVGWPGFQVRDTIVKTLKVAESKLRLEGLVGASSLLIDGTPSGSL